MARGLRRPSGLPPSRLPGGTGGGLGQGPGGTGEEEVLPPLCRFPERGGGLGALWLRLSLGLGAQHRQTQQHLPASGTGGISGIL